MQSKLATWSAADSERKFDRMLRVTSNYGDVVMAMSHC